MEESFAIAAAYTALGIEAVAVLTVLVGAIEAGLAAVTVILSRAGLDTGRRRQIWLRFAAWIILALEFALGADIIRTAIAPSWDDIGKLAAIAAIRTALNYFLERDIDEFSEDPAETPTGDPA